jgi:hypothetical protein
MRSTALSSTLPLLLTMCSFKTPRNHSRTSSMLPPRPF